MAVSTSNTMTQWFFTKYTNTTSDWATTTVTYDWGEPYEPTKQNKENKCSVQEPPRKKNIRFLNRPA